MEFVTTDQTLIGFSAGLIIIFFSSAHRKIFIIDQKLEKEELTDNVLTNPFKLAEKLENTQKT